MAKLVKKTTTTTVTEEIDIVPEDAGEEIEYRFLTVHGYGEYQDEERYPVSKPQIIMNAKWLFDAGFRVGDRIQGDGKENQLVIRKLVEV